METDTKLDGGQYKDVTLEPALIDFFGVFEGSITMCNNSGTLTFKLWHRAVTEQCYLLSRHVFGHVMSLNQKFTVYFSPTDFGRPSDGVRQSYIERRRSRDPLVHVMLHKTLN